MDTLLRETVNTVVNSRFPEMSIEGRRQIESILIREEYPKGVIALNEGEVAHELVFVGKGMLRQYYYKNGKEVTETLLIRRLYPDVYRKSAETSPYPIDHRDTGACCHIPVPL